MKTLYELPEIEAGLRAAHERRKANALVAKGAPAPAQEPPPTAPTEETKPELVGPSKKADA
jgi:hypothetical protein